MLNELTVISREAGRFILSERKGFDQKSVEQKNPSHLSLPDLVSYVDKQAEALIKKRLSELYPETPFIGEETFQLGDSIPDTCFIVDPLDGTTNYVAGLDYYCVCIAYIEDGMAKSGVVYHPSTDKCYSATTGTGMFVNDIPLSPINNNNNPVLIMEEAFGGQETDTHVERMRHYFAKVDFAGFRKLGSTPLNVCFVADGLSAVVSGSTLKPWDIAAIIPIAMEAGLLLIDRDTGKSATIASTSILCCHRDYEPYL